MGRRGPAPTPTNLKLLRGNPGKRRINRREPKPASVAPSCPTWLSREAKAEWRRVVPELARLELLARIDRAMLAAFCQTWADYYAAVTKLRKTGETYATETGFVGKHPLVSMLNEARTALHRFAREFGLTPSSRSGLAVPEPEKEKDPLDALLERRAGTSRMG